MIVVTGAAGFIGSNLLARLADIGYKNLVAVDAFADSRKLPNLADIDKTAYICVERSDFLAWLDKHLRRCEFIFHFGARTDTQEQDKALLTQLNTQYTKDVFTRCQSAQIPLIYASSAATYGDGQKGFDDNDTTLGMLKPLNPYGQSKHDFDVWVLKQKHIGAKMPFFWMGLKFFNVYGPQEYHKNRMASVVWHAYHQIRQTNQVKLFRSYNPKYADGAQQRDFIYVKDVLDVCLFFMQKRSPSGIYNLGTGRARTFDDLAKAVFKAMNKKPNIAYIDMPNTIKHSYQYFTESNMTKMKHAGYSTFHTLEKGVADYVQNYLVPKYG